MKSITKLFNIEITDVRLDELLLSLSSIKGFNYIVTPNVQHIVDVNQDQKLMKAYESAFLRICDSKVLQLISRFVGKKISNVIPGSDLTKELFKSVISEKRIMIVGPSKSEIEKLQSLYPCYNISFYEPPMGFISESNEIDKAILEVDNNKPEILFLAVGFPRQEILAYKLKQRLSFNCVAFCIGASIDFLTGKQKRAPIFWQKTRLEWLYRFIRSPRRLFRRYFIDSWAIIPLVIKEFKAEKKRSF